MGPHKIAKLLKAKDTVNKTKRPPKDWERIFTYPKSDRGLISNIYIYIYIYKEIKKVDSKKSNNLIKKWEWVGREVGEGVGDFWDSIGNLIEENTY